MESESKANKRKINILIVDDKESNLSSLHAVLEAPSLQILTARSGNEALGLMLEHDFALVILDVRMPNMDGLEVAELMKTSEKTRYIPIIFITASRVDRDSVFRGYRIGAADYLFKPVDPLILQSKVNTFLELYRNKKELECSKLKIEKQNEQLKELSIRDGLTNLYNHRYFQAMLTHEFSRVRRSGGDLSCIMMDLDLFKEVNDRHGHAFGDYVLVQFSRMLKASVRSSDIPARYGGEEFGLLLPDTHLGGALVLAEKFRLKAGSYLYKMNHCRKRVTISIGIASFRVHDPASAGQLLSFADRALYRAKGDGRNLTRVYGNPELIEKN